MDEQLPLAALLSQTLVAFTIEFDNEAERRIPHRTTRHGVTTGTQPAPWLVSLAMWENCMRHVPAEGIAVGDLELRARTHANLPGMERWRYIKVSPDPADRRPKIPRAQWVIKPTLGGRTAQEIWRPLAGEIEGRWRERFGTELVAELRSVLTELDGHLDPGLPDCLPILKYGLVCAGPKPAKKLSGEKAAETGLKPLYALLSRALLTFALEFEKESELSLAICSDLLRVIGSEVVRLRDLPALSGVSKEAISMGMGILRKARLVVVEKRGHGEPWLLANLTAKGREAAKAYRRQVADVEGAWNGRYGKIPGRLRAVLRQLGAGAELSESPLGRCLDPYPEGWRAELPRPAVLPHFPMVLHRGGYPDGS